MEKKQAASLKSSVKLKTRRRADLPDYTEEETQQLADFFKIFGDPTRIKILCELYAKEACVGDLAEALDMSQSAISHQLRVIKAINLVKSRREGKNIIYYLADNHVRSILMQGREHIAE